MHIAESIVILSKLTSMGIHELRETLILPYLLEDRHYHELSHIEYMLSKHPNILISNELIAAIWLHDIVYDPQSSTNEMESAALARDIFNKDKMDIGLLEDLILSTKNHEPLKTFRPYPARVLIDLDLAILGEAPKAYRTYAEAIRKEYSFVPDNLYREGRIKVLNSFLEKSQIYRSPDFTQLEPRARYNIAEEIERLRNAS